MNTIMWVSTIISFATVFSGTVTASAHPTDSAHHPMRHDHHSSDTDQSSTTPSSFENGKIYIPESRSDEAMAGGPLCPAVRNLSSDAEHCKVPICDTHSECEMLHPGSQPMACCYNGCKFTCMQRMPDPIVFDHIGEDGTTPKPLTNCKTLWAAKEEKDGTYTDIPINGLGCIEHDEPEDSLAEFKSPGEVVAMEGGCIVPIEQFKELMELQKRPLVDKCVCKDGNIQCKVSEPNLPETAEN